MVRAICFFVLLGSALGQEPLDVLVKAATSFSAAIVQQLQMLERDPSPREFAQKTIDYATARLPISKHFGLRAEGCRSRVQLSLAA